MTLSDLPRSYLFRNEQFCVLVKRITDERDGLPTVLLRMHLCEARRTVEVSLSPSDAFKIAAAMTTLAELAQAGKEPPG